MKDPKIYYHNQYYAWSIMHKYKGIKTMVMLFGVDCKRQKLADPQRFPARALKITKNAKLKDALPCPGISVENMICFDRNVMT